MKLDIKAATLAGALLWGGGVFFLTWWIILFDGPSTEMTFIGQVYRGYTVSSTGSVIGLLYGLADGAIGAAILAWLYNRFAGSAGTPQP